VSLDPGGSYGHGTLARVLARLSKPAEALQEAQRALALAKTANDRQRAEQLIAYLQRLAKQPGPRTGSARALTVELSHHPAPPVGHR